MNQANSSDLSKYNLLKFNSDRGLMQTKSKNLAEVTWQSYLEVLERDAPLLSVLPHYH